MKLLILRKSKTANYKAGRIDNTPDTRLEKFRKLILEHLSTLDDEEAEPLSMRKAFSSMIRMEKGGKGLAVGTVREWKGRKFKKIAPGKWRPVYDSETRGAKMAIAAIKRKIAAAPDAQTMMRIILENRDRFSDKNGQPLPFVQELSKYTADEQDRRGQAKNTPQESKAVQPKGEKGKGQEKVIAEKKQRNFYEPGKPKRGQAAAMRRKVREKGEDEIKEWEQRGADDFKAGKPFKTPWAEIVKPGTKIGSPESKEANKKMEAWQRGWVTASVPGYERGAATRGSDDGGNITGTEKKQKMEQEEDSSKVYEKIIDIADKMWQGGNKKADNGLYGISGDIEKYKAWGGKEWKSGDQHRIYFNGAKTLKNLYGLQIVKTEGLSPGDIVRWKSRKGLKWLPLGNQYPVEAYIGNNRMDGDSGKTGKGNRAWEMLTSKPYYDVNKQEFIGLSGPMIETSIAMERASLEALENYKAGKYPDIPQGLNVDNDIQELVNNLEKMGASDNEQESEDEKSTRARLRGKFETLAVPMKTVKFTRKNYDKLFPGGILDTPLGEVKMGEHQFEKLKAKNREEYLGAVFQTLHDPVVIIESEKDGKKAKLYTKSFKDESDTEPDIVISVVVNIDNTLVSISTHRRGLHNTLNKIKKDNLLYEKEVARTVDTGTFNSSSSNERQPTNQVSAESSEKSSEKPEASEEEKRRNRSGAMKGNKNAYGSKVMREAAGTMTNILETGKSSIVTHKKYGDITVDAGEAKNRSFGLKHIIKQRHDEGKSVKETAALLVLLNDTLQKGEKKRDIKFEKQPNHRGRMELDYGGIVAIVSKQRNQGDSEQWVLTGYDDKENKEATGTIQEVISRYGYTPEFLGLERQVGAVVSSLSTVSPESGGESSDFSYKGRNAAMKAVKILEEKGDTSKNFREALDFIGSPEFEKLHEIIDDYMDNVFQSGVNMEKPQEADLVRYVRNYYGAAFGAGGVPKEIIDEYDFINDYVVWPEKLQSVLRDHIHWEDGKSAYESADDFARLVMDIGDAESIDDIERLSKEAISKISHAANGESRNLKKAISNAIDFFRNLSYGKGPRFVKKAVPVRGAGGAVRLSERWIKERG